MGGSIMLHQGSDGGGDHCTVMYYVLVVRQITTQFFGSFGNGGGRDGETFRL
jgi:hypothetical protein